MIIAPSLDYHNELENKLVFSSLYFLCFYNIGTPIQFSYVEYANGEISINNLKLGIQKTVKIESLATWAFKIRSIYSLFWLLSSLSFESLIY